MYILQLWKHLALPFLNASISLHNPHSAELVNVGSNFKEWYFSKSACLCLMQVVCWIAFYFVCICADKLGIPGHGGYNLTRGLTLVNPLLGVVRMMM